MMRQSTFLASVTTVGALFLGLVAVAAPAEATTELWLTSPTGESCQEAGTVQGLAWHQRTYDPARVGELSTGEGVTVAVLDTGVDGDHPQLTGRVLDGRDLVYGGSADSDCLGHGTAVASIIAGAGDPDSAFVGYATQATILPFVVSEDGTDDGEAADDGAAGNLATAIRSAVSDGARVINISLVVYVDDAELREAVADAVAAEVVVVASVGSPLADGTARAPYPASYPGVIGVGAVDSTGLVLDSSATGPWVDLVAPGAEVMAATRGGGYGQYQGTSLAAPFVTAAAALVLASEPDLSAGEVASRLFATADPAMGGSSESGSADETYGWGIVDAYRAVTEVESNSSPRPENSLAVLPSSTENSEYEQQVTTALLILAAAVGLVVVVGVALAIHPRGRRRRWRPGRAEIAGPKVVPDPTVRLFDDLEA